MARVVVFSHLLPDGKASIPLESSWPSDRYHASKIAIREAFRAQGLTVPVSTSAIHTCVISDWRRQ